jgi:hypothetical protein
MNSDLVYLKLDKITENTSNYFDKIFPFNSFFHMLLTAEQYLNSLVILWT